MFFEGLLLGVGWDGVEIQVKGIASGQAGGVNLGGPGRHQAQIGLVIDLGTVGGQVGALGNDALDQTPGP